MDKAKTSEGSKTDKDGFEHYKSKLLMLKKNFSHTQAFEDSLRKASSGSSILSYNKMDMRSLDHNDGA